MFTILALLMLMPSSSAVFNGVAMRQIVRNVYVEDPVSDEEHVAVIRAVRSAYSQLQDAFGGEESFEAVVFVCRAATCKLAFGAAPQVAHAADLGFADVSVPNVPRDRAVVVTGPNGSTARVLTHELVHALMKSWAPYDALPTWLNEGLATAIADEPSCAGVAPTCELDVMALATKAAWQAHLAKSGDVRRTYCQARHAAHAWASFGSKRDLASHARTLAESAAKSDSYLSR